ncbi:NAD-dependent epimerase/dehydratase family protein [Bacillus sp. EB106-08-02-XG196]|uniref:NAD-dependent epimerase/dehydratase family protein n=1 Tax=Bacillus sp. EB106-08-02-XG196 TaxID=2737049 RepID=UPI0015C4E558|nr:NAD-dependent epimerase/dehydratase family protein [Bacillus sp. EB106-08-02-XG196]NWQ42680.1 NAD-dependent epimerase/dehydratase family protein [Bacillus sp. EB106-08-02-XG196]
MKAIVTGGAGFIGSHLVEELVKRGFEVHVLDNLIAGRLENVHPSAIIHVEDIRGTKAKQIINQEKPDIVFHLAAQADVGKSISEPNYDASVNINGTINILEACHEARVKRIIFASTSAVYGDLETDLLSETDLTVPISYYGLSKLTAESYIRLFSHLYKLPFTILRYGNVYGPRQLPKGEGGVIAVFLNRIKRNEMLLIHGDGEQTRDFIYVKDIVLANIAAIKSGDRQTFNISTSRTTSINQLIGFLNKIHGSPIGYVFVDGKKGDIKHSCLNNQSALQSLEWHPTFDILQGLEETYAYVWQRDKS